MSSDPRPPLPVPRGPVSELVVGHLRRPPHPLPPCPPVDDPLTGDDLHLALYACYELHYRSFAGVDEGWEWDPNLLALRRDLESAFELGLLADVGPPREVDDVEVELLRAIAAGGGPSLSTYMAEVGTGEQLR